MFSVSDNKANGAIFIPVGCHPVVVYAAEKIKSVLRQAFGMNIEIFTVNMVRENACGLVLTTCNLLENFYEGEAVSFSDGLTGDGFAVISRGDLIFIVSLSARGVFFGACDFLEKNAGVVFARGARGEDVVFAESDRFDVKFVDYCENSPFSVRGWNLCGTGSDNKERYDEGTAEYLGSNKSNAVFQSIDDGWRKYGLFCAGLRIPELNNADDLIDSRPEYFMTGRDGKPARAIGGYDSFFNYYNREAAKEFARRLVKYSEKINKDDSVFWVMPDSPYFYMTDGTTSLCDKPFTADDGTTVYPSDVNYKSTVYFNFLNHAIREACRIKPDTRLSVFAYLYAEPAPAIAVDDRLTVYIAPINANDKYSFIDKKHKDNAEIRKNIEEWSKKSANLGLYVYWDSFRGEIYSRPICEMVKENLIFLESLGVKNVVVEGRTDCTVSEDIGAEQKACVKFYDMNEPFIRIIHKLLWNPYADTEKLLVEFCNSVYKECADLMFEYFSLIKSGYEERNAMVWYATGGDVYYLQFVIKSGIADKIADILRRAERLAKTETVKRKIVSIRTTIEEQIAKYRDFVEEQAYATYTDAGEDEILSETQLNYVFNKESVWNTAKPLTVLRNYETLDYYPKEADFSCRMLYDDKNLYIGYTVFDDGLISVSSENGRVFREDGSEVESYAETYIGGNIYNQAVYYGFISGFKNGSEGEFYINQGVPKAVRIPQGVKDVKYVHLDDADKKNRYYVHVQKIPFAALGESRDTASPYGSFVYYTDRYGRAGWMGFGLWSKENFAPFRLENKTIKTREKAITGEKVYESD